MSVKSIIQIEIQDESYKKFIDSYQEYSESLAENAEAWKRINYAAARAADPMGRMSDDTYAILNALNGMTAQIGRFNRAGTVAQTSSKATLTNFQQIRAAVTDITSQMIRWGSVGAGVLGAATAGFYALKAFSGSESNLRKETKTLGISAGEFESQQANFGKFIDVQGHLHGLNEIRNDLSKRGALNAAGLGGMEGLNNADFLAQSLLKVRETYIKGGGTEQAAQAYGLHEAGFSTDELQLLKNTAEAEMRAAVAKEKSDRSILNQQDKSLKEWQDLNIQMDIFTRSMKVFTASVLLPTLKFFTGGTPDTGFTDAMNKRLDAVPAPIGAGGSQSAQLPFKKITPQAFASKSAQLNSIEKNSGLPSGLLSGVYFAESSNGKNLLSPKGAKGPFQFMDSTAMQYGVKDPFDFSQSAAGASKYFAYLKKKFHNDIRKILAGYNAGEGNVDNAVKNARKYGGSWEDYLPKPQETIPYINKVLKNMANSQHTTVTVNNQTGGNATVALSTVAH